MLLGQERGWLLAGTEEHQICTARACFTHPLQCWERNLICPPWGGRWAQVSSGVLGRTRRVEDRHCVHATTPFIAVFSVGMPTYIKEGSVWLLEAGTLSDAKSPDPVFSLSSAPPPHSDSHVRSHMHAHAWDPSEQQLNPPQLGGMQRERSPSFLLFHVTSWQSVASF